VVLRGAFGQMEPIADFSVGEPSRHELGHLLLPVCQRRRESGGIEAFMSEGIGLDRADLAAIREDLLEDLLEDPATSDDTSDRDEE